MVGGETGALGWALGVGEAAVGGVLLCNRGWRGDLGEGRNLREGGPGGGERPGGREDPGKGGDLVEKSQGGGQPTGPERPLEARSVHPCPVNLHYWDSEKTFGRNPFLFVCLITLLKMFISFWLHRLLVAACGIFPLGARAFL